MDVGTTFIEMVPWDTLGHWLINKGQIIFVTLLIAIIVRLFSKSAITKIIRRTVHRSRFSRISLTDEDIKKRQTTLIGLCTAIVNVAIFIVVIAIIIANVAPFDATPLFASAGIIGIALGFGAQTIIKDFLTGIFIISENQYRVGDVVTIDTGDGATGTVEKVSIRSTVLRDADGNVHYVPNGNIDHVINKTMGYSRVNFSVTVEPDTNVDKIADIINQVGLTMAESDAWKDKILVAPTFLNIGAFTDRSLEIKITGKTQPSQQWSVTGELRRRLLVAFKKHHIQLAHVPVGVSLPPKNPL